MPFLKAIRSMPNAVLGLLTVFLALPVLSVSAVGSPLHLYISVELWKFSLVMITYWALPVLIVYALALRHHWFLPLHLSLCVLLTAHTLLFHTGTTSEVHFARFLLVALMIYVGILFGNKNFLYPFISKDLRFWRKSVRYRVGRMVKLVGDKNQTVPALMQDASKAGMALYVHRDDVIKFVRLAIQGIRLEVNIPYGVSGTEETNVPIEIAWVKTSDHGDRRFGCKVLDKKFMKQYVQHLIKLHHAPVQLPEIKNLKQEEDFQQTALVLWLICIALSFAVPALS